MGEYNVGEAALVLCFVSLMAVIVYFIIPDRRQTRRIVVEASKPAERSYRPLWADSPTKAPVFEIDPQYGEQPALAA